MQLQLLQSRLNFIPTSQEGIIARGSVYARQMEFDLAILI